MHMGRPREIKGDQAPRRARRPPRRGEVPAQPLEAQRVVRDARRLPRAIARLGGARVPCERDALPHEQSRAEATCH